VPVVVDLWAPWCGPCRTLGPTIEKVVDETEGAAALAKVNVDENPQVSATFQVQSIPAVYAIYRRRVVDSFIGALPEQAVRQFVEGLVERCRPTEVDLLVGKGDEASLRRALELEPASAEAITALASLLVERGGEGDDDEALSLLERIPETPETRRLAALARTRGGAGSQSAARADVGERIEGLLGRVPGDDEARQEIVDLIETMSEDDPRRDQYRRALAAKLF
jgi:putative thioredoxin